MRIIEVTLQGMGRFSSNAVTFDLDENRVVVLGPNEAGKSTLMRSISALIFGFDKSEEEARWRPWVEKKQFGGEIVFDVNGKRYQLQRQWGQDYVRLTCDGKKLFDEEFKPRGKTGEPFLKILSDILPLTSSQLFHKLSFISQEELQTSVTDDIRERITGGHRVDALRVRENFEDMYGELTWEKPSWGKRQLTKKRIIEELEDDLKEKRDRRNRAVEATRRGGKVEMQLQEVEDKIATIENDFITSKRVLDKQQELVQLLEKENQVKERLQHLNEERERVERLANSAQSLETGIQEDFSDMHSMPTDTDELLHAYKARSERISEITKDKLSLENDLEKIKTEKVIQWLHLVIPCAVGIALGCIVGFIVGKLIGGCLIGLVVGGIAAFFWTRKQRNIKSQRLQNLRQKCGILKDQFDALSEELEPLRHRIIPILKDDNPDEALAKWKSYQELNRRWREAQAGLKGNRPIEAIKNDYLDEEIKYKRILDKIEELAKNEPYLGPFRKTPEKLGDEVEHRRTTWQQMEAEISSSKKQRENLRLEWTQQVAGGIDDVDTLDVEIQEIERQLIDYRKKKAALILAWECLSTAIDNIKDEHRGGIQNRMDCLFRNWTGNIDRSVMLDDSWNPWVEHQNNPKVAPELLSRGTLDQLYLAYRVALSEALSKDIPLPFLLDDPFVHFDPERRKLAKEAFEAISERHQVILFTQDPSFGDWGKLIKLL